MKSISNLISKLWTRIVKMKTAKLFIRSLAILMVYEVICGIVISLLGIECSQNTKQFEELPQSLILSIMYIVFYGGLREEIIFRWIPMMVFTGLLHKIKNKFETTQAEMIEKYGAVVILVVFSLIFGLIHGNIYNIFTQGVGGLMMSMIYLREIYREKIEKKTDRLQIRPLLYSVSYHTIYDTILLMVYRLLLHCGLIPKSWSPCFQPFFNYYEITYTHYQLLSIN